MPSGLIITDDWFPVNEFLVPRLSLTLTNSPGINFLSLLSNSALKEDVATNSSIEVIKNLNHKPETSEIDNKIYDFIKKQLREAKNYEKVNILKEEVDPAKVSKKTPQIKDRVKEELEQIISNVNKINQPIKQEG